MNLPATLTPLNPGDKLGPFEVQARVGAGGSSVVYQAFDALLNRHVAIKQLLPTVDDAAFRQRFRQEAKLQSTLCEKHPGLVKLIDAVEDERGVFLVMAFVHGMSLEQVLMRTGRSIDATQTLKIVWATAKALQAVHDHGVVHRDIKPSNLLLQDPVPQNAEKPGEKPYPVKIADLGVATLIAEQEAMSLGSVRYMAPELFGGGMADGRADLYSLGMVFYEMLIGRRAFEEVFKAVLKDERNQAVRWMKWHTNRRAQVPLAHEVNPALPETLGHLVQRLMAKDVADRVATAEELAQAIERHFTVQGVVGAIDEKAQAKRQVATSEAAVVAAGDTARLPEKPKVIRSKKVLVLFATSVLLTAGLVTTGLILRPSEDKQARLALEQTYVQAQAAYQAGDWQKAEQGFARLVDAPKSQQPEALLPQAQAGLYGAQAQLALIALDLEVAEQTLLQLRGLEHADAQVVDLLTSQLRRAELIQRLEDEVNQGIQAGRLGDARDAIDAFLRSGLVLSDQEKQVVDGLVARVIGTQMQTALAFDMSQVDQLLNSGQTQQALERLQRMEQRYASSSVANRMGEVMRQIRHQSFKTQGDLAVSENRLPEAIHALAQALVEKPDDQALADQLSALRVREAVGRGERYLSQGRPEAARDAFAEALSYGASEVAVDALGQLDVQEQVQALIRRGQAALLSGGDTPQALQQAMNAFEAAVNLDETNQAAQAGLRSAQVQQALVLAEAAFDQGQLEQAETAFEQVLSLEAGNARAQLGLNQVRQAANYRQLVLQGDQALEASRFGEAMRAFRDAKQLLDTQHIRERIEQTEFAQLIAQARVALTMQDAKSAQSYLKTAWKIKQSPLVDQLMQEAQVLAESQES